MFKGTWILSDPNVLGYKTFGFLVILIKLAIL